MSKFSQRLYQLRKENKYTQDELSDILNQRYGYKVSKGMVSKYESGIHEANFLFIDYVSELFGVSSNYLMGRTDSKYGEEQTKQIPLLGAIAAGTPITAQEDIVDYECVDIKDESTFALVVKGDSMINVRIFNGDIIYVRQQPTVENGEIAAVMIDDEVTLKRVYYDSKRVILHSENPTIPDMMYTKSDMKNIRILGKVIKCKFDVR